MKRRCVSINVFGIINVCLRFLLLAHRATSANVAAGRVGTATMSAHPSLVEWKKLRFVIMDAPKANNLHLYLRELKKQNVVYVVRVCEPTYPASEVEAAGMKVKR